MSVTAKIEMNDGTTIKKLTASIDDLMLWLMKHHGEYNGFEAHTVKTEDMRQGREPE